MNVAANLASVVERIGRTGRNPDEVTIVAVTKGFGAGVCAEALHAGLRILGENRVQEALPKIEAIPDATWHLIGHLQTNKVATAVRHFAMIQTVDSARLAEAIAKVDPDIPVLVEVNIAREPQRSGLDPALALEFIHGVSHTLNLQGLMGMGPAGIDPAPAFTELRRLHAEAQERLGRMLPILSMGMSSDFEAAVRCGSTMVRLGEALFGPRPH
ncbi:MAG TPA: YggS family pyridoxal phosphate-dependent enzyme [Candidatus Dormibacteraeota bacterium]|nr:YggS family pyridoxal phosphate-dependent enzyme [Candidatus Dormibacteraeota bacterium]